MDTYLRPKLRPEYSYDPEELACLPCTLIFLKEQSHGLIQALLWVGHTIERLYETPICVDYYFSSSAFVRIPRNT